MLKERAVIKAHMLSWLPYAWCIRYSTSSSVRLNGVFYCTIGDLLFKAGQEFLQNELLQNEACLFVHDFNLREYEAYGWSL